MTRLALISDQHGNDIAFAATVADIEAVGVDEVVCLGDVVEGGAQPRETLERLMALGCRTVLGNADDSLFEVAEGSTEPTSELEVRDWTLSQLEERHIEFLRTFEPTITIEIDGKRLLCFHGSPKSYDDLLLPELDASVPDYGPSSLTPYLGSRADLLAGGHIHVQWAREIDGALYVNPGSVGLAWDRHQLDFKIVAVAEWALVTIDALGIAAEFRKVPYSRSDAILVARESGRPYASQWADQWAGTVV